VQGVEYWRQVLPGGQVLLSPGGGGAEHGAEEVTQETTEVNVNNMRATPDNSLKEDTKLHIHGEKNIPTTDGLPAMMRDLVDADVTAIFTNKKSASVNKTEAEKKDILVSLPFMTEPLTSSSLCPAAIPAYGLLCCDIGMGEVM